MPSTVETLLELDPQYTRVYEAHSAITQEWAAQLVALGVSPDLALGYDRATGAVTSTLGALAARAPGTTGESFHFVLNNTLAKDNRIPAWGTRYEDAVARNIVPVPAEQYGDPGPGEEYDYWDELVLDPPPGGHRAELSLLYQPTSWEYVQFLALANDGSVAFLADEGVNLRAAWLATGMAAPYAMATASWSAAVAACSDGLDNDGDGGADHPADPGCASATDESEHDTALPCDDRRDDDADGLADYPADPGCRASAGQNVKENPPCDDDVDNDGDGQIDWDGGASGAAPDATCQGQGFRQEKRSCGLGAGIALLVPALVSLRRRRRHRG